MINGFIQLLYLSSGIPKYGRKTKKPETFLLTARIIVYTTNAMSRIENQKTIAELIAQNCIGVRVRLLNRVVTRIYDDALRPLGIKTSQLNILVVIARLGLARPAEICNRLKMKISTLSRNVERMRARRWIEVIDDDRDARAHQLRLSVEGLRLLEKAEPGWAEAQQKVEALLGAPGVEAIASAAEKIRAIA